MRAARHFIPIIAALAAAAPGAAATLARAGDGAAVAAEQADAALALDRVVVALGAGESLAIADQRLVAETESRALISLSSEFLTIVVTHGRLRLEGGPDAGRGQVLLLALDGTRVQRLGFNAARLAATLSPGARPLLGDDLARLTAAQRRGAFWGTWEPLRVNASAPGGAAGEALRATYLSDPAIVRQRRQAAGVAEAAVRGRGVAAAFVAAYTAADVETLAGLLDPEPFLRRDGPDGVREGRQRAASALLADTRLRPVFGGSPTIEVGADGASALLASGAGRWRLTLVARDRAIFVQALEPAA